MKNVKAYLEAAERLERARTDALKLAGELQATTAVLEERRQALIAGTSLSLRDRYEGALRAGLRPAVVPIHQAACSGCGEPLTETARRSILEAVQIVSCSGCGRLVYDQGWVERDFMPPSLRPVQQTDT
jgi:predicted  nucleic acid-binding Zn-ribbon protein